MMSDIELLPVPVGKTTALFNGRYVYIDGYVYNGETKAIIVYRKDGEFDIVCPDDLLAIGE